RTFRKITERFLDLGGGPRETASTNRADVGLFQGQRERRCRRPVAVARYGARADAGCWEPPDGPARPDRRGAKHGDANRRAGGAGGTADSGGPEDQPASDSGVRSSRRDGGEGDGAEFVSRIASRAGRGSGGRC